MVIALPMPFAKPFHAFFFIRLTLAGFVLLVLTSALPPKLEITGQKDLTVEQGKSITLELSHFTVKGPGDKEYPKDFRLLVFDGNNYSVSGTTVIPDAGFAGTLKVVIRIQHLKKGDVKEESDLTEITITVKAAAAPPPPSNTPPRIVGQKPIRIVVNQTIAIGLNHLNVVDPDNSYPADFTLKLSAGSDYSLSGNTVVPANEFTGTLVVRTVVNDGKADSQPYELKITVVEDGQTPPPSAGPPVFTTFSDQPLAYSLGNTQFLIAREVEIDDPDSEELAYAEVFFDAEQFLPGKDELAVQTVGNISSVYDANIGMLVLFGRETLIRYEQVLRSVRYNFASDSMPDVSARRIHFRLNDGENASDVKTKSIVINEIISLDIPNVFSPNDDNANDLWEIRPSHRVDDVNATVRVFDKRGVLLFETRDLTQYWDGRYRGELLPADAYFYTIDVASGVNRVRHQGTITILR